MTQPASQHEVAGQLGGRATVAKYGPEWMAELGRRGTTGKGKGGGSPTWQETVRKAWARSYEAQKRIP